MIKNKKRKLIIGIVLFWLASAIFSTISWANGKFSNIDLGAILFYIKEPLNGTNMGAFTGGITQIVLSASLMTLIICILIWVIKPKSEIIITLWNKQFIFSLKQCRKYFIKISLCCLILALIYALCCIDLFGYIYNQLKASSLYEEHYVNPQDVTLEFPEEKRNLIYIFMESMENTYMSAEEGGIEYDNFISEMTELTYDNTNFTASKSTNGAISAYGSTWTMGAMVAQTAGIPLNLPIDGNGMENGYDIFLPGAYSIGQILDSEGYNQVFLLGSDAIFGGRSTYMTQHGNYTLKDFCYAKNNDWIDDDYYVWWGYEDQKLYDFAKNELLNLSKEDKPFNLTLLTVDTHFFSGYFCDKCEQNFGADQYADVISCASRQVTEFVEWVQQQDFYENTTIVICGDHPTMDETYLQTTVVGDLDLYQRTVYTTIINSALDYELDYDRVFTTMDMYPTTLASLGVKIDGNRLALGTNLYSDTPTLVESMGYETLNEQLQMTSKYYNKHILYAE